MPRAAPPAGWRVAEERPQLALLGGFALRRGGDILSLAPSAQRLVSLLALHETALPRDYVAGLLWRDSAESRASGSLRSVLWKLQLAVPELVCNQGGNLRLAPQVDVDIRQVTKLARSIVTGYIDEDTIDAVLEPRFCCELLPGSYDDWILIERERHRQLALHALESVCEQLTADGRYGAAILAALAAIDREPLRESAHRALIRVHISEGNACEAIAWYRHYEQIAARELGIEPSPLMRSVLSQIPVTTWAPSRAS
jgi:DNA-binding SARP family transcriptional activator